MLAKLKEVVTIEMAIARLTNAGVQWAAEKLSRFSNIDNNKSGWDGHARAEFNKNILRIIWPNEAF